MTQFDQLLQDLQIIDENITAEAVRQPLLFIAAARYRVDMMRKRAQLSAELDAVRVGLAISIRNKPVEDEDGKRGKLTEGAIKERIERQPKVKELREALDRAEENEEMAKLILEAYRERKSSINIIAEMQIFEGGKEGADVEREEQRRKLSRRVRTIQDRRSAED